MSELRRILSLSFVPLALMVCLLLASCGGDEEEAVDFPYDDPDSGSGNGDGGEIASERIVFLPVTPGGNVDIRETLFQVDPFYMRYGQECDYSA